MKNNKKFGRIALIVALLVVVCVASIGGTIAWLTDKTEEVKNTFLPSNIDLQLEETYPTSGMANMIPGGVIAKDPKAILSNDVDAYLFVTVTESEDPDLDKYIKWTIADGWSKLEPETETDVDADYYVYYREVQKGKNQPFPILKDNKVTVLTTVEKADMDAIATEQPTLSFQAYAIQKETGNGNSFKAVDAWNQLKPVTNEGSGAGSDAEGN